LPTPLAIWLAVATLAKMALLALARTGDAAERKLVRNV
jgi:hypothetical protein